MEINLDIDSIKFNEQGLVPAITQDTETGDVLMFAWMNLESLKQTMKTRYHDLLVAIQAGIMG